jgi:hypothetical protein
MFNLINNWLSKINNEINVMSHYFFTYKNKWFNLLLLLMIIFLFLLHLLCFIDFIIKCFYSTIKFIYYLLKYIISLFQKEKSICK